MRESSRERAPASIIIASVEARHVCFASQRVVVGLVSLTLIGIGIGMAACASVADLDVAYNGPDSSADALEDTRQQVRESSVEPKIELDSGILPTSTPVACDGDLSPDAACDNSAGFGCCLTTTAQTCIDQSLAKTSCLDNPKSVFVACRQAAPDSACCWQMVGNSRVARFVADCDGGPVACVDEAGCPPNVGCRTRTCAGFLIGQCGNDDPPCPDQL